MLVALAIAIAGPGAASAQTAPADTVLISNSVASVTRAEYDAELLKLPIEVRAGFANSARRVNDVLARMLLRPRRRARVDATLRKGSERWGRRVRRLIAWPAAELRARRETKEAIRRARKSASERDGNVISPKAFKGRRRDLH